MPAKKFRFVSPGVQIKEIDKSQISALPDAIGPVVIGRTLRGPGMVPVTVNSYEEFVEKFGTPDRGAGSTDVWRNGNTTAPLYASYAAEAYLRNSSPLTMVRLMGTEDPNSIAGEGEAGWKAEGGAHGLFIMPNEKIVGEESKLCLTVSGSSGVVQNVQITLKQNSVTEIDKTVTLNTVKSETITKTSASTDTTFVLNIPYSGSDGAEGLALNVIETELQNYGLTVTISGTVNGTSIDKAANFVTGSGLTLNSPTLFNLYGGRQHVTGTLAALFYTNADVNVSLVGLTSSNSGELSGSNTLIWNRNSDYEFKMKIGNQSFAFNFNKNSSRYIRKVFNTNPTLTNAAITPDDSLQQYWLGESFESFLRQNVQDGQSGDLVGYVTKLAEEEFDLGNFKGVAAQPGKSGWVIGQDLNALNDSYDASKMPKLFRLVASEGEGGDWEQNNVKISIFDIKAPVNEYQKYGTFSIGVRKVNDVDSNPEFVEVFTGCSLDPTSPNYVAAKIGDRHLVWVSSERRHVEIGEYPNISRYIRVEMNPTIEQGGLDPELLPFGFIGPPRFKTINDFAKDYSASSDLLSGTVIAGADSFLTASLLFPSLKLRVSASEAGTLDLDQAFYGVVPNEGISSPIPKLDEDYRDIVRAKPAGVDSYKSSDSTEDSFVFSLDDIVVTGSTDGELTIYWQSGSRQQGSSLTALEFGNEDWTELEKGQPSTARADKSYKDLLDFGVNRFTMPLFGGTDGLDIKEREPFRNTFTDGKSAKQNYALSTLFRAIDSVREPEVLNMNLLVLPGITNKAVTKYAMDMCENRADALAIIDIEGGYQPSSENASAENDRIGGVRTTVAAIKQRNLNTSYGCTYYPWVKVLDTESGQPLWMPPSVVALGTMASSQERSEVWFAPAGFNRGGLTLGSSGLSVVGVREKLSAKQRDSLYEVNINPIASFPSEGIVIFGQKTLQAVPSALDRINVRRLVLFLKKQISIIASGLLFEPNVEDTWNRFRRPVVSILDSVKSRNGISEFRLVLDSTTTTAEEIDRNMMYAKLFIKPVYAIEFIGIDFVITNTGASFEDL